MITVNDDYGTGRGRVYSYARAPRSLSSREREYLERASGGGLINIKEERAGKHERYVVFFFFTLFLFCSSKTFNYAVLPALKRANTKIKKAVIYGQ